MFLYHYTWETIFVQCQQVSTLVQEAAQVVASAT